MRRSGVRGVFLAERCCLALVAELVQLASTVLLVLVGQCGSALPCLGQCIGTVMILTVLGGVLICLYTCLTACRSCCACLPLASLPAAPACCAYPATPCHAPCPVPPLQFFQKNDNTMNDAFMVATGVAALYLVYKVFEQLETLN